MMLEEFDSADILWRLKQHRFNCSTEICDILHPNIRSIKCQIRAEYNPLQDTFDIMFTWNWEGLTVIVGSKVSIEWPHELSQAQIRQNEVQTFYPGKYSIGFTAYRSSGLLGIFDAIESNLEMMKNDILQGIVNLFVFNDEKGFNANT